MITYALGVKGWQVKFYDKADKTQVVGVLSSDIQESAIGGISFDLVETGCGDAEIVLAVDPSSLPFTIEYNQGVEIYLYHTTEPWYSGYIIELPVTGTTKRPWRIKVAGYYNQLETCVVNKNYTNMEVSAIVADLMDLFIEEKTDILLAGHKIVPTAYTVSDVRFDYTTGKKAIQQLADLAQSFVFGVDAERELFFRGIDPQVNPAAVLVVGRNISEYDLEEDATKLFNRIYVKAGLLSGTPKTNIQAEKSDYNSQVLYGVREKVLTAPSIRNVDDADRWGAWKLDYHKRPKKKAKIPWAEIMYGAVNAKGKARIIDKDGNDHRLEIKKASYDVDSGGIRCSLELGMLMPTLGQTVKDVIFAALNDELLQGQNMSQL